eukprot:6994208-Pyramimonas_sp.AAC.1
MVLWPSTRPGPCARMQYPYQPTAFISLRWLRRSLGSPSSTSPSWRTPSRPSPRSSGSPAAAAAHGPGRPPLATALGASR